MATRTGCDARSGAPPGPAATAAAVARRHSAGGQATPRLERRQRARLRRRPQTFFSHRDRDRPCAHDGQQGQRPHHQGDMAIPAGPATDFVVIQAHFPIGRLNATLDGLATARHPHRRFQRGGLWGKDHICLQLRGGADTAPDQQPAAPPGLRGLGQRQPAPVIPARPFGAIAGTQPGLACSRQGCHDRVDLPMLPAHLAIFLARDREHIGLRSGLQPQPQAPVIAIHAVPGDP